MLHVIAFSIKDIIYTHCYVFQTANQHTKQLHLKCCLKIDNNIRLHHVIAQRLQTTPPPTHRKRIEIKME